jgi:hypothetical protein
MRVLRRKSRCTVTKTRSLGSFGIGTGTSSGWAWRRGRGWGGWCSTPFGIGANNTRLTEPVNVNETPFFEV